MPAIKLNKQKCIPVLYIIMFILETVKEAFHEAGNPMFGFPQIFRSRYSD